MKGKAYAVQPGTIPYRVVQFLHEQAALGRHWVPAAEVSEHVGQKAVSPYLEAPMRYGVLVRRPMKHNGRLVEYALGDGKALPPPADHEPDEALHASAPLTPRPGPMFPEAVDTPAPKVGPRVGRPRREDSKVAFHAGLFLDGSMLMEVEGVQVTLAAQQVAELARLLRGVAA